VEAGDVLVADRFTPGLMRKATSAEDKAVVGVVSATPGVALGAGVQRLAEIEPELAARVDEARARGDREAEDLAWAQLEEQFEATHAAVALSGTVACKVDAGYGPIEIGDLLVTSPTTGHAMRADEPAPGTVLGKALEPLNAGAGTIKVLVMLR
jgi:Mrp family chromosome partitioning ATPase